MTDTTTPAAAAAPPPPMPDAEWRAYVEARLDKGDEKFGEIRAGLKENTEITKEVLSLFGGLHSGIRVLGWLANTAHRLAKWASPFIAVWLLMRGKGHPPES